MDKKGKKITVEPFDHKIASPKVDDIKQEDDKATNKFIEEKDEGKEEFNKFLKGKGIDRDENYHWLSADEQKKIKYEFKKHKEIANVITKPICQIGLSLDVLLSRPLL
jgi:hypothetical protein